MRTGTETSRGSNVIPPSGRGLRLRSASKPSRHAKPKKLQEIKQGEKWHGSTVKRVGRGWFVVEDSTDSEVVSPRNQTLEPSDEPAVAAPASAERQKARVETPESTLRTIEGVHTKFNSILESELGFYVTQRERLRRVIAQIARIVRKNSRSFDRNYLDDTAFICYSAGEAGYNGPKKIPWCSLPLFLCQRNLYITGFPSICLPKVTNDEVKHASSPSHWRFAQLIAMEEALNLGLVKILPRPSGMLYISTRNNA